MMRWAALDARPNLRTAPMQHTNEYSQLSGQNGVGAILRDWRSRRGRSQMDLALDVGVSTRHLSFIETGRVTDRRIGASL